MVLSNKTITYQIVLETSDKDLFVSDTLYVGGSFVYYENEVTDSVTSLIEYPNCPAP